MSASGQRAGHLEDRQRASSLSDPHVTVPTLDTPSFGPDTVLIASDKKAHRPCRRHNDDTMTCSKEHTGRGWVPIADPERWSRVNEAHLLRAAHGDTSRVAIQRCRYCSRA